VISGCSGAPHSSEHGRVLQLLILLCVAAQACAASHTLVLVVRADSKVSDLDS